MASGQRRLSVAKQIAILTESLHRLDFARQHGIQYQGDRDLYAVGGYKRTLQISEYQSMYDRDPIAGQIVDMAAEATWRATPEISEEDQEDGTEFTETWADLAKRLGVWNYFERADRMGRIGRYSVLLIGTAGGDDRTLETEMSAMSGPDDVIYLAPFNEKNAKIEEWVTDSGDPRYGMPLTYSIDMSSGIPEFRPSNAIGPARVHWSRVIHVAEGLTGDEVYGRPALQRVFNDLEDLQKITTSTAEAFWQRVAGILGLKIDKDALVSDTQLEQLDDYMKELYHELRKTFYLQGGELYRLGDTEPDPSKASDLYMTRIAAGSGYPKRILFGSETGERASTEDQKTYLGSISERQKQHAEPRVLRPFIDRLIQYKALPRPTTGEYEVVWPTLYSVPEHEVAESNRLRAEAIKALTPMGGDPTLLYEVDEERNIWPIPRKAEEASPFEEVLEEQREIERTAAEQEPQIPRAA